MDRQPILEFFATGDRRHIAIALGIASAVLAALLGLSLALIGPLYTVILVAALAGGVWVIAGLENALYSTIMIALLLPYATMPFKVVLTPSFLDIGMVVAYFIYIMQWMSGERRRLATTPVHAIVILFMLVTIFSFIAGLRYAGLTSNRLRQIAELMMAIGLVIVLVDVMRTEAQIEKFVRIAIAAGTVAALLGIVLWLLPDQITESLLARLAPIGYPSGGVIHYIEDNPELAERATSTSVDPNSFGGVLVVVAALAASLLTAKDTKVAPRWMIAGAFGLMVLCLGLTFSRGAMLALAAAIVMIAVLGERRLLWVLLVGGVAVLLLPQTQEYVQRFAEGFAGQDLATKMRFGEYQDALTLIFRYPLIGVGFSGAPDIDIYIGVSSLYLLIASNMGIIGLLVFILLFVWVFAYAWTARRHLMPKTPSMAIWLGLGAALITMLATGIFDHYYFNLEFFHASTVLWTFVGLLLAMTRIIRERAAETEMRAAIVQPGKPA
jgi:O-antigen ligase